MFHLLFSTWPSIGSHPRPSEVFPGPRFFHHHPSRRVLQNSFLDAHYPWISRSSPAIAGQWHPGFLLLSLLSLRVVFVWVAIDFLFSLPRLAPIVPSWPSIIEIALNSYSQLINIATSEGRIGLGRARHVECWPVLRRTDERSQAKSMLHARASYTW